MEENNKIYCKEDHIPKTKTRKGFLKAFIELLPETYTDNKCTQIQCINGRHRSVTDLHNLVQSRFKKTSLKAVVRIIYELNDKGRCDMVWCNQINKFVVRGGFREGEKSNQRLLTNYSHDRYIKNTGIDDFSFVQMQAIKEEIEEENEKKRQSRAVT